MIELAYVGSRTTRERAARGSGITVWDTTGDEWSVRQTLPATNPSYLALSRDGRSLYAAHGDGTTVSTQAVGSDGGLTPLNAVDTAGTNPAHVVVDPTDRFVLVANHGSGSVTVLPRLADGALGPVRNTLVLAGEPGPHRIEQTGPKPHQVCFSPCGRWVFVPDKGRDRVAIAHFDPDKGALELAGEVSAREGAGPRHAVVHPSLPVVYVINELASTVTVHEWDDATGRLDPVQIVGTLDPRDVRDSRGGALVVHPTGTALWASNRSGRGDRTPGGPGDDTIAGFTVATDGTLTRAGWTRTGGVRPRFATLSRDGALLHVANERSDVIRSFTVDPATAVLDDARDAATTGSPTCIVYGPGSETP